MAMDRALPFRVLVGEKLAAMKDQVLAASRLHQRLVAGKREPVQGDHPVRYAPYARKAGVGEEAEEPRQGMGKIEKAQPDRAFRIEQHPRHLGGDAGHGVGNAGAR
jgi:hypothetical protein